MAELQPLNTSHSDRKIAPIDYWAEAFADAMMAAQMHFIFDYISDYKRTQVARMNGGEFEAFLERRTDRWCDKGCTNALAYLAARHQQLFDTTGVFKANNSESHPFNGQFDFHTFFFARSTHGVWYAGSPANYDSTSADNPLTQVLTASSAAELLMSIAEQEGGLWPDPTAIKEYIGLSTWLSRNKRVLYIPTFCHRTQMHIRQQPYQSDLYWS